MAYNHLMGENRLVVVYHPDFALYGFTVLRERLEPAFRALQESGCLDRPGVKVVEPVPVDEELVRRVHTPGHIRGVLSSGYYEVSLLSAGAVALGAEEVASDRADAAFCFVGAAGHHASRDGFWGFCYLNDVAIAVEDLRGKGLAGRFAIIDIDPHFGDGTRDILGPDPGVLHVNFYGGYKEEGQSGPSNHDFQLPWDCGDELFLAGVEKAVRLAEDFRPDLLFVIFGHDGHADDYGAFELTGEAYGRFAARVKQAFPRRVCYVLSGGSNPRVAREAVSRVIDRLSSPPGSSPGVENGAG